MTAFEKLASLSSEELARIGYERRATGILQETKPRNVHFEADDEAMERIGFIRVGPHDAYIAASRIRQVYLVGGKSMRLVIDGGRSIEVDEDEVERVSKGLLLAWGIGGRDLPRG